MKYALGEIMLQYLRVSDKRKYHLIKAHEWIFSFLCVSSQKYLIAETLYSAEIDTRSIVDAFLANVAFDHF